MPKVALFLVALFAATAVHAQTPEGRLKRIAETKTIAVGYRTDAMPFSFFGDKNEPIGFSIDLCKRIVNSIERQLGIQGLKVNWVPVTLQSRFEAVAKGRADMECGSSTMTLTRMKEVDFSSVTFVETTGLLIKTASGLRSLSDMTGKKIAVVAGTTNERAINVQLKRRQLDATVLPFKSRDEAFAALEEGKADAFASDKLLLIGASEKAKDQRALTLLADQLSFEPYGIVLPRGDAALRLAVNTGLAQIYAGDEIVEIYRRWFGAFGRPSAILEAAYNLGAIPE
ncbi:MAG TPA: amino acid ABC transporter substrate-binding protein [Burkholderiales bacterium]|nr:amino acid ABC transporter substrate-binding protein [Burkholderiales bacterium]